MKQLEALNKDFSTTRLGYKLLEGGYLDERGMVREELKFNINLPELGIRDSKIPRQGEEKFDTYLFLPEGEGRQGEGGLRTRGYFKFSYEIEDGRWYACDFRGRRLFEVEPPREISLDLEEFRTKDGVVRLPLVSIVTVVLNGEKYLEETIQSVINQTYPDVEYIIIDGGSTDGTLDIIKRYESYIDYWVSEKDRGIYDAMNKGLTLCIGNWLNFLNCEDYYFDKDVLLTIVKLYLKKIYKVVVGLTETRFRNKKFVFPLRKLSWKDMPASHQSFFYDKDCLKKIGKYDISYKICSDYELWCRLYKNLSRNEIRLIDNIIVSCERNFGISSNNRIKFYKERFDIVYSNFGFIRSLKYIIYLGKKKFKLWLKL